MLRKSLLMLVLAAGAVVGGSGVAQAYHGCRHGGGYPGGGYYGGGYGGGGYRGYPGYSRSYYGGPRYSAYYGTRYYGPGYGPSYGYGGYPRSSGVGLYIGF